MSNEIIFPNAPITEAIFDIRVQLSKEMSPKMLEGIYDHISDRFDEKKIQRFIEAGFQLSVGKSLPASSGINGYFFRSKKEQKVVQARLDGFTFNKLKPYENWNLFFSEGKQLWELYSKIAQPIKILRIALRYINRIEVPLPFKDFNEYILTNPEIAPGLPQEVSNFFIRLEIPVSQINAMAIVIQTIDKPSNPQKMPLILDIDVSRMIEKVDNFDNMEIIWKYFEELRALKNDIFLKSLTDKAKELFK